MKKIVATLAALAVLGFCAPLGAQEMKPDDRYGGYPRSLIEWPKAPLDLKACQAMEYYEPADLHLAKYVSRVKVAGTRIQSHDECSWMLTRNKWRQVLRPTGTKVLHDAKGRDLFDGGSPTGKVCYNPRPFSVPILPEKPRPTAPTKPEPVRVKPTPIPPPAILLVVPIAPIPPIIPDYKPSTLRWGLTAGVSRESYSGPIADRDICEIKSTTLNLGVTYGDPYRFFGRLTAMGVLVGDGSSSNYICTNCGTVTAVSRGMKVLGGNLEFVGLVGPKSWKVQPTLYAEGGGGVVTGNVIRYVNGTATTVDASELLGYKTQAHGGGGAGLTWHAGSNVSVEVLGKYRYPYGTSVGVMLTVWQK